MTPPGQDTNPSQVSFQLMLTFIYLLHLRKESWVSLGRKGGCIDIQILAERGVGTMWSKGRVLTNCQINYVPIIIYGSKFALDTFGFVFIFRLKYAVFLFNLKFTFLG